MSILQMCTTKTLRGAEKHILSLYKRLREKNVNVHLCIIKDSPLASKLQGLPYETIAPLKRRFWTIPYNHELKEICEKLHITMIHCHSNNEIRAFKKLNLPVKLILTRHIPHRMSKYFLQGIDVIIGVSKPIVSYLEQKHLKAAIHNIPPLFEACNITPTQPAQEFFKQHFNIELPNCPILCIVAHLCATKNHTLLFKALHTVIYEKKKPVHLLIAGTGPLYTKLVKLAEKLKITNHISFLGFTDKVAEILFYSNINILPSKLEGLSVTLLEAAMMKKPSIAANSIGMKDIIEHTITGLLFENNNFHDLADKIEILLNNPAYAKKLGENAYTFVQENLAPEITIQKHMKIYNDLTNS